MSPKPPDPRLDRPEGGEAEAAPWPRPDCPPATDLERLILRTASAEEREALVDHFAGCESCSALVRDLRSLEGWAERVEREHRHRQGHGRRRRAPLRWALPVAAMLLLAVGGAAVWTQLGGSRSGSGTHGIRGAEPEVTPAPGSELARPPERFSWPERPGASGYRLRLFDARGKPIWESDWLADATCPAPEEVLSASAQGRTLLWTVEVRGAAAGSELGPFTFVLAGASDGGSDG